MLFDFFLFLICFAALLFSFSGYLLSLAFIRKLRAADSSAAILDYKDLREFPFVHFILPTLNEALLIQNKIRNLATLEYPNDRRCIWICDGGSQDTTMAEVARLQKEIPSLPIRCLVSPIPGKIAQMNQALVEIPGDAVVVVSDADAVVHTKTALMMCVAALGREAEIGLIGGWTNPDPKTAIQPEIAFWDKQNRTRHLETITYSASIVVAPFYVFRRSLIGLFPEDCVADDVYISYVSHLKRLRVLYTPAIQVTELRSPKNLNEMFLHKLRKAHAYTTELFRVLYRMPYMNKRLKYFYMNKLMQFFYLPWAFLILSIETIILVSHGHAGIVASLYGILIFLVLLTSYALTPPPGLTRGGINLISFASSMVVFVLMNLVLTANFLIFPFWRQSSSYSKVGHACLPR